jgi:hypothetical protein
VRANISAYGPDTSPGGGFALQHGTTAQMHYKPTGESPPVIGTGKDRQVVGKVISILVAKNKVAPPNRSAMITLTNQPTAEFGPIGIDRASEAFQLADQLSLWNERKSSYYTLLDGSRHNGQDAVCTYLRGHPQLIDDIRERALATVADTVITDELKEGTA